MISFIIQTRFVSLGNHQRLGAACKMLAGFSAVTVVMCARTAPFEQHHSPGAASLAACSLLPLWMARGKMLSDWRLIRLYCEECPDGVTGLGTKWSWNQDLALFAFPHLHRHWPGRTLARAHSLGHSCLAAARPHLCECRDAVRNPTFAHSYLVPIREVSQQCTAGDENFYSGHDKYGQPKNPPRDRGIRPARIQAHRAVSQEMGCQSASSSSVTYMSGKTSLSSYHTQHFLMQNTKKYVTWWKKCSCLSVIFQIRGPTIDQQIIKVKQLDRWTVWENAEPPSQRDSSATHWCDLSHDAFTSTEESCEAAYISWQAVKHR